MTAYNPQILANGKTDPENRATARPGRQVPNRSCGYTRLDSMPATTSDVAWALAFDWKMNTATSEHIADALPISNTHPLLGSALLLGGRPLAAGRRRRKATTFDYYQTSPQWDGLHPTDSAVAKVAVEEPWMPEDNSVIQAKTMKVASMRAQCGQSHHADGLAGHLWQVYQWMTSRAVAGAVTMVSTVFVPALLGYDRASAFITNINRTPLTLDISAQASDGDEWKVDGVDHLSGAAMWFYDSVDKTVPQSEVSV